MNDRAPKTAAQQIEQLEALLTGEARSLFARAYREHHRSLMSFLRQRVGSEADAADIAQEAYLRVLRYRDHQDLDSLKALLFRIATNLVLMRARTAQTHRLGDHVPFDEELPLIAGDPSQERQVCGEQQLDLLMEAVKTLPHKCRQVFVLSRFHDMSHLQIAARCGISVKMVEKHIARALAICRQKVGGELP